MNIVLYAVRWVAFGLIAAALALLVWRWSDERVGNFLPAGWFDLASPGYSRAVARAAPSVVSIQASSETLVAPNPLTEDPLFQRFFNADGATRTHTKTASLGSGVILDPSGVALTNYHVVRDGRDIHVSLADGRSASAFVVGVDPDTDLAVIKIELDNLPSIPMGDSDTLRVGDIVLAIGNPFGIGQTVTQGIVSATGRNRVGINTFENFIQTDAAINFGNSGGALINHRGQLVGINSVRLESEGIGFAIPTSIALAIARELLGTGTVKRGWLGIDARDLSENLKAMLGVQHGIVVLAVMPGGPADQAGVLAGDVLTALGEFSIMDSRTAIEHIASFNPGTSIELQGVREGRAFATSVTVSRRPLPPD